MLPFMVVGTSSNSAGHEKQIRCVLCRRRRPEVGHSCRPCRDRLDDVIADIPRKYDPLAGMLVPSSGEKSEGKRGKRDAAPLPLRVDVLNVIGPSNPSLNAAAYGEGALPTLEVLAILEHRVRRERQLPEPDLLQLYGPWLAAQLDWARAQVAAGAPFVALFLRWLIAAVFSVPELKWRTVRSSAVFLRKHVDWVCGQDWLETFAGDVKDAYNVLRDLHGEHRPKPIGLCPALVDRSGVSVPCGETLWAGTYSDTVRCRSCGETWDRDRWQWLGMTMGVLAS